MHGQFPCRPSTALQSPLQHSQIGMEAFNCTYASRSSRLAVMRMAKQGISQPCLYTFMMMKVQVQCS